MKDDTKCLHSGYAPGNTELRVAPIVKSTTYRTIPIVPMACMITLLLVSCAKTNPVAQGTDEERNPAENTDMTGSMTDPPATQPSGDMQKDSVSLEDNPIDRAFERFASQHDDELDANVIFAYLRALKWYEESLSLANETYYAAGHSLSVYPYHSTAYEYGKGGMGEYGLVTHFEGIARFYRMLAFDSIAQLAERGIDADIRSDEDDVYSYLGEINFEGNYDYGAFSMLSWTETRGRPDPMPAIAGVDGKEIFFFHTEFGAVIDIGNGIEPQLFLWEYLTPRLIMPRLTLGDFNGDGVEDLAVILYNGSGTGVAIEELHILNLDYFAKYYEIRITDEEISRRLRGRFYSHYEQNADEIVVRLDNQEIRVDVSEIPKVNSTDYRGEDFSSIISFDEKDGILSVNIKVGLCGFDIATPFAYVDFCADLVFDESFILSLSNCRIEYEP